MTEYCEVCGQPLPEEIDKKTLKPCTFEELGCDRMLKPAAVISHERACKFNPD